MNESDWRGARDFDRLDRRGRDPSYAVAEFETQDFDARDRRVA
jgi:hypothetical protein